MNPVVTAKVFLWFIGTAAYTFVAWLLWVHFDLAAQVAFLAPIWISVYLAPLAFTASRLGISWLLALGIFLILVTEATISDALLTGDWRLNIGSPDLEAFVSYIAIYGAIIASINIVPAAIVFYLGFLGNKLWPSKRLP